MSLFLGTPKLESRNCPGGSPGTLVAHNSRLQSLIATRSEPKLYPSSRSFQRRIALSIRRSEEVDAWLLVVRSQTASLTPGPSFAHNLVFRCPNGRCEAIFDIYASRTFQWHQEHLNARCFGPCCRTLNIRNSRRTPNPQLWKCWASPPHLAKVGLRQTLRDVLLKECHDGPLVGHGGAKHTTTFLNKSYY